MALRRHLCLCLCTSLLLAVAVAVSVGVPRPAPSLAPELSIVATGSCYKTVKGVPQWCAQMFIKAVFNDKRNGVTDECCVMLACVREWPCADLLRGFCLPPEVGDCPGSPKRMPAFAPAATNEAAN